MAAGSPRLVARPRSAHVVCASVDGAYCLTENPVGRGKALLLNYPLETSMTKLLQQEMEKEGIPFLYLETDYSPEDVGQLTTRIQALIEMVSSRERA